MYKDLCGVPTEIWGVGGRWDK